MISPETHKALQVRMQNLGIREAHLDEKFIRSSGKGGQNVNKVSTCVYLRHEPSGVEVKCQKTRSQADNRYWARRILCDKLEAQIMGEKSAQKQKIEKLRRQKRKRSKRAKDKMLQQKHQRSQLKATRKKPRSETD